MRLARLSVFAIVLAGCGNGAGGDAATPGVPEQTQAISAIPSQPETLLPTPNATSPTATPVKQTGTVIKSAKRPVRDDAFRRHRPGDLPLRQGADQQARVLRRLRRGMATGTHRRLGSRRKWDETGSPRHHQADRRYDPGEVWRPSAVLLRPRGQKRGEVPQHPRVRRSLAGRDPGRPTGCTLTSFPMWSAVKAVTRS